LLNISSIVRLNLSTRPSLCGRGLPSS
jgi:hypothetical protein